MCGVSDDTRHWLVCPHFHHERQQIEGWQTHHAHDTTALMAHLLPSRSPFAVDWKQALLDIPCALQDFLSAPGRGTQHVFTDGSATCARSPYRIAAWGSLNSTTGEFISMGHVPGLRQTSDRAELLAVMSTLAWQQRFQINLHLWIDSKFVADGLLYLLAYGVTGSWANMDLWLQVEGLLQQIGQLELTPHWIPSHLDTKHLECPFEDWVQLWNDRIDVAVGRFNLDRPEAFLQLRTAAIQHYDMGVARLRQLRAFYFAVASNTSQAETETSEGTEVSLFGFVEGPQMSLFDLYIPSFEGFEGLMLSSDTRPSDLPMAFILSLLEHLHGSCSDDFAVYPLCFEELTMWLIKDFSIKFPFSHPVSGEMELHALSSRYERPTFSYLLRCVRRAVLWFLSLVDDSDQVVFKSWNKVDLIFSDRLRDFSFDCLTAQFPGVRLC